MSFVWNYQKQQVSGQKWHILSTTILVMLCYSLIYPSLTYGVHFWGLTFPSFLTQLFIIKEKKSNRNNILLCTKIPFWASVQISHLLKLNDVTELQILYGGQRGRVV